VPPIRHFNAMLGVNEADFMNKTQATFKLGIEFRGWHKPGDAYLHSFGSYGKPLNGVPFHQQWLRMRQLGDDAGPFDDYSLPIVAAHLSRFAHTATNQVQPFSVFPYAFQFDASLYARYLRAYSESREVVRTEGKVVDVALRGETGFIAAVTLESGERIEADLFIDCSGFRGLLIEQALHAGYDDWTNWLPCDRSVAAPCEAVGPAVPFTRAIAEKAGWRWRIPLQHRIGNGAVYCSTFMSDDEAVVSLTGALEGRLIAEPKILRFTTGRRKKQWVGNCVAIGLSGGFLEPLESTSIGLIQIAILNLIQLFPDRGFDPADAEEFNRIMNLEFERVRDFLVLHYHATTRGGTPFWDHCRTMPIPDSLAYKEELFRERGVLVIHRDGFFQEPSWLSVFFGQGVMPRRVDPLCETLAPGELQRNMAQIRQAIREVAENMPTHAAFLENYCAQAALAVH
jgi:tryptophan halogenase